jgi:opacity protein-like surface antigen
VNVFGALHKMTKLMIAASLLLLTSAANAADILDYLTDKDGKYSGPTVEQNISSMDTDKNGFADVTEVRAFLALKYGSEYEKGVLDRWEVHSLGGGCPIPFAKEFLSEGK